MNEDEQKLQSQKIVELLNEITLSKQGLIEKKDFKTANQLGRCYEIISSLHVANTEAIRDNRLLTDHKRLNFAGQAMQAMIIRESGDKNKLPFHLYYEDIVRSAFNIADSMVNYGKANSETNGAGDGIGSQSTKDSD
jgi:hypothetical protein